MEEDILKYSPTVMFRGTPCSLKAVFFKYERLKQQNISFFKTVSSVYLYTLWEGRFSLCIF